MNPGLAALAIGIVAAGVLAVVARDTRLAIVAALVVAVVAPLLGGMPVEPLALAVRFVAGILAAFLLWAAVRGLVPTAGSPLGLPAEVLLAVAAAVAGTAATWPLFTVERAVAAGAGAALVASAAPLALAARDALRLSVGALLAVHGAWLLRSGIIGRPSAAEDLAVAVLVVAIGGVGAALVARARGGSGTLELGSRRAVPPEAEAAPRRPAEESRRERRRRSRIGATRA
jgi:hypothetical protein